MKLVTARQMREIDRWAIEEIGIPGVVLMENAGRAAAEQATRRYGHLRPGPVLVLAGKGNNGGDGFVIARHLSNGGWRVRTVVLADAEGIAGDARVNLEILRRSGSEVAFALDEERLRRELDTGGPFRLIFDALFGTGLASEVRGHYAAAIDWINGAGLPVCAVDIPSGVDATSGRLLGRGVRADLTVTFAAAKIGQILYPGAGCVGELAVVDIGIPSSHPEPPEYLFVEARDAAGLLPPRPATGHKGTFGHLLVVAGSRGKTGAAAMAAEGGLRIGAGLVTVACPQAVHDILAVKLTEAMTLPLPGGDALGDDSIEELRSFWEGKSAVALGPGLGQEQGTVAFVRRLLRECPLPLVLDADGLNAVADAPEALLERKGVPAVLTPHPGEMARLLGSTVGAVEEDRIGAARDFAVRYGVALVLKGARTVIAFADGRVRINGSGNPGMACGGMGDALTGVIGGLLAQGLSAEDAAVLGVHLHGLAADRLVPTMGTAGMVATDLLREIPAARRFLHTCRSTAITDP